MAMEKSAKTYNSHFIHSISLYILKWIGLNVQSLFLLFLPAKSITQISRHSLPTNIKK